MKQTILAGSLFTVALCAQSVPEITFDSAPNLLKLPEHTHLGEVAGVATNSHNAGAARDLIQFVAGPSAAPTFKAKGVEPR